MAANNILEIEKDITYFLIDWKYYLNQLHRLQESLSTCTVKLTTVYEENKASGGMVSSSVERCVIKRAKIEEEIKNILDAMELYITAINHAGLTQTEKDIIKCLMNRKKLLKYAKEKNIYHSNVYKIKERAVRKIAEYILSDETTNRIYKRVKR